MQHIETPFDEFDCYTPDEGIRIIVDECLNSGTVTKGRKHPQQFYKVLASFDIETTKLRNLNIDTEHNAVCYKWFNITYCWQFMINSKFIFGRRPEEFFTMLRLASEQLEGRFCVFVHNFAFEFNNLADFFTRGAYTESFFRNGTTPLYVRWGAAEFRCTAQMTHKSLAQIGDDVGIVKLKEDFDYSASRDADTELTPVEMSYVYRDCAILNEYLRRESVNYSSKIGKEPCTVWLPITQTGYVRADIKKEFSNTPVGQYILKQTELSYTQYIFIRPAFFGGFTHANFRYIGQKIDCEIEHYDITSAYPWAFVMKKFPYRLSWNQYADEDSVLRDLKNEDKALICFVTLIDVMLKKGHTPYIPYTPGASKVTGTEVIEENGKVVMADTLTGTFCDVDLRLILRNYDVRGFKLHTCYDGIKKPLPWPVVNCILNYYEGKTTLKGIEGMEYEYGLSKQLLNGIYGLSATDLMHSEVTVNPETLQAEISDPKYEPAKVLPYQWSIYCTAYVREVIYGIITKLAEIKGEDGESVYLYSDTDSIFAKKTVLLDAYIDAYNRKIKKGLVELSKKYFNIFPVNKKGEIQYLGTLVKEKDDMIAFGTIGAKRYYIEHPDGTVDITFSGLRATKTVGVDGTRKNGYNTQRLIDTYGSVQKAFEKIKEDHVELPYVDGVDKLSNFNVRYDFRGKLRGKTYTRPCTYTLYGQSTNLSLNVSLLNFLGDPLFDEVF